jgi:hypothetical protein
MMPSACSCGLVSSGYLAGFELLFSLLEEAVDFLDQFHQFGWVLLFGGLLAEFHPPFFLLIHYCQPAEKRYICIPESARIVAHVSGAAGDTSRGVAFTLTINSIANQRRPPLPGERRPFSFFPITSIRKSNAAGMVL